MRKFAIKLSDELKSLARSISVKTASFIYRDQSFECLACGARLTKFLAGGTKVPVAVEKEIVSLGYRNNLYCPVCWSTDRERLLLAYLRASEDLAPTNAAILHVAPEPSICRLYGPRKDIVYITADLLRPNVNVSLDIHCLALANESIDLVVCNHVLEHVRDDRLAMREIFRVMKPGAHAILQVPIAMALDDTFEDGSITDPRSRELAFGQDDHVRLYGRDYGKRLKAAGFLIEKIDWRNRPDLFGEHAAQYGFNPNEKLFVVEKP